MDMAEIRLRLLRLASGGAIEYLLCTLVLVHDHTIIMVQLFNWHALDLDLDLDFVAAAG